MKALIRHTVFRITFILLCGIMMSMQFIQAQWSVQDGHTPENLADVIMLDSLKAIAIGDRNSILRTSDAGSTWINETVHLSAIYHWNAVSFSDTLHGTVVGDHTVWGTTDGGISWNARTAPSMQKCLSVLQISPGSFFVGADSGWMYFSADTGKTWTSEKISAWQIRDMFMWRGPIVLGVSRYFALTPYSLCTLNEEHFFSAWAEDTLADVQGLDAELFDGELSNGGSTVFIVGVSAKFFPLPLCYEEPCWRVNGCLITLLQRSQAYTEFRHLLQVPCISVAHMEWSANPLTAAAIGTGFICRRHAG